MSGSNELVTRVDAAWLQEDGPSGDVVLSSRARLARNLASYPFPHRLSEDGLAAMVQDVRGAAKGLAQHFQLEIVDMGELSDLERQVLVERHVISPNLAMRGPGSLLILSVDEKISIMVNEEDHIRIQCVLPGLAAQHAWEQASWVDDVLEQSLDYAFSPEKGFLTSCPTNAGTGLRVSVMVHTPALAMTGQLRHLFPDLGKIGMAVRGLYGEGSQTSGNVYQVSNQVSLGRTEQDLVLNLEGMIRQIRDQERSAREMMLSRERLQLEDRVYRAYGTLTGARIISSEEMVRLVSDFKLGVDLNLLPKVSPGAFKRLLVMTRPGYLQLMSGESLGAAERDIQRASLVRRQLDKSQTKGG